MLNCFWPHVAVIILKQELSFKTIRSGRRVRILKGIEKKTMGDVYTLLCLRSAEFDLRNLCYSKISEVILLGYRVAGISRKLESER